MIREYIIKISDEIMEEEIADRPQELVRCKDCKKHGEYECPITMLTSQTTDAEGFCDEGERK